jgi:hypothetical protein
VPSRQPPPVNGPAAHGGAGSPAASGQLSVRGLEGLTAEEVAEVAAELVALREWQGRMQVTLQQILRLCTVLPS